MVFDLVAGVVEDADEAEVLEVAGLDLLHERRWHHRLDLCRLVARHEPAWQNQTGSVVRLVGPVEHTHLSTDPEPGIELQGMLWGVKTSKSTGSSRREGEGSAY
jgi:hypothetical protein